MLIGGAMLAAGGAWAQQNLPPEPGRDVVAAKCYACHAFEARVGNGYTEAGWTTVLRMMSNHGAQLTADEMAQVKQLPNPDKQFIVMPGIAHSSARSKNYALAYHAIEQFFSQPAPVYSGA